MTEVQNVVDTAFGSMSYKCEEFADTAIEKFGMSKLAAKQFASTYMAMGKGSGLDAGIASDMAIGSAGRIGDIASFYNKSLSEVDTMMKSIYTGETESLKQIGVVMTEVNLQQFAYRQGIQKNISAMTQAEKIQLRYAYVMDQTNLAAGDFEKTSNSWANQTRILSERWKELLSILGKGLIQVLAPVVKFLNVVVQKLIDFANVFSKITAQMFGKQEKISLDSSDVTQAAQAETDLADATTETTKANEKSMASFDELNTIGSAKSGTETGSGAAGSVAGLSYDTETMKTEEQEVESGITAFVERLQELLAPFKEISFDNLSASLGRLREALAPFGETIGAGLAWLLENVLAPLSKWTVELFLPAFLDLLSAALNLLSAVIAPFIPLFQWLWDNFLLPIAQWTGGVIISVLEWLTEALNRVADWIRNNQGAFLAITGTIAAFFAAWKVVELLSFIQQAGGVAAALKLLADRFILAAAAKIKDKLETMYLQVLYAGDFLKSIGSVIASKAREAAAWVAATAAKLKDKVETLYIKALYAGDFIKSVASTIAAKVKEAVVWAASTAAKVAEKVATIAYTVATTLATAATTALSAAIAFLTSPIGLVIAAIAALIAIVVLLVKHWDDVKEAASKVWDNIKEVWGKAASWFSEKVLSPIKNAFKGAVNWLIGVAEKFVNGFIGGINKIIGALNKISFKLPDFMGGKSFGINISQVKEISLPKLASGAVIPPNAEFAAILGDQRNGRNLEAPEGLIRQIISEELAKHSTNGGTANVSLYVDGRELARVMAPYNNGENNRLGVRLINGVT